MSDNTATEIAVTTAPESTNEPAPAKEEKPKKSPAKKGQTIVVEERPAKEKKAPAPRPESPDLTTAKGLLNEGRGVSEIAARLGKRRSWVRRVLKNELKTKGLDYAPGVRIVDGKAVVPSRGKTFKLSVPSRFVMRPFVHEGKDCFEVFDGETEERLGLFRNDLTATDARDIADRLAALGRAGIALAVTRLNDPVTHGGELMIAHRLLEILPA